jgi:tRNA(fMet)-specific endonuclease VapC
MQEVLQGRLAVLNRQQVPDQILLAYAKLQEAVHFFTRVRVVAFDTRCQQRLEELRAQGIRIGTLDLRIAATALVHDLTLITRNHKDFARVPGLRFESWAEA